MKEKHLNSEPVVIIGIDAANWKVLDYLIDNGFCPNLSKMIKGGTISNTVADDVLLSPIIWTSVGTGKKGYKHGIKNFFQTSSDVKCKMIWEILSKNKISCGIFHWPLSSPPTKVYNGFNIPIYSRTVTTYPKSYNFLNKMLIGNFKLRKTAFALIRNYAIILASSIKATKYGLSLKDSINWIIDITIRNLGIVKSSKSRSLTRSMLKRQIFGKVFLHKLENTQTDFVCFYMSESDHLQHFFWDEFFDSLKIGRKAVGATVLCKLFSMIDDQIGDLISLYGNHSRYLVLSDHGMKSVNKNSYSFNTKFILELSQYSNFLDIWKEGELLYVNVDESYVGDSERLLENFCREVSSIKYSHNNNSVLSVRHNTIGGITVFTNNKFSIEDMRNLEIIKGDSSYPLSELLIFSLFEEDFEDKATAVHSSEGVFIAQGPGIKSNLDLRGEQAIKDVDIVPTVLNMFGLPSANDFDGRFLKEIFTEEYLKKNSPSKIPTYEKNDKKLAKSKTSVKPDEAVLENLRRLGYID